MTGLGPGLPSSRALRGGPGLPALTTETPPMCPDHLDWIDTLDTDYPDDGLSGVAPEDLYTGWCEDCGQHTSVTRTSLRRIPGGRVCDGCLLDREVSE